MRQAPIVERLKQAGFPRVYGALELAALETPPPRLPALFVVPLGEDAGPNKMVGVHDQAVAVLFGVVVMVAGNARREDRVSEDIEEERKRVEDALVGWTHPDASRACDFAGGKMLSVSGNTVSWMVSFRTARRIRKAAQ